MNLTFRMLLSLAFVGSVFSTHAEVEALASFQDPLQTPAMPSRLAAAGSMLAVAHVGDHLVAVGRRGLIVVSDAAGTKWTQATVPLSSDLVAVHFPTAEHGWAVGHSGVILHTNDGGYSWTSQADGRSLSKVISQAYLSRRNDGAQVDKKLAEQARRLVEDGPIQPLLSVWFRDERVGFVVGAFGLIFRTEDGGKTWVAWMDRIDNPKGLHIYSVCGTTQDVYIAGEQGLMARLPMGESRFRTLRTPYEGSYFGVAANTDVLLIHGMRGNASLSVDAGATWKQIKLPSRSGITAAEIAPDRQLVLVTQTGEWLVSRDLGASFSQLRPLRPMPYFGLALFGQNRAAMAGPLGVRIETFPDFKPQ